MIQIIVGTNRPSSNSKKIALQVQEIYTSLKQETEIIDLVDIPFNELDGSQYSQNKPSELLKVIEKIDNSEGIVVICPEYNGSMPGILKLLIDHLSFPKAFERRPVCFIGLGGRFGGLRPVEHLQQVFGYRNAFIYPFRVFLINVWQIMKDDKLVEKESLELIHQQCEGFVKFVLALQSQKLHANQNQ